MGDSEERKCFLTPCFGESETLTEHLLCAKHAHARASRGESQAWPWGAHSSGEAVTQREAEEWSDASGCRSGRQMEVWNHIAMNLNLDTHNSWFLTFLSLFYSSEMGPPGVWVHGDARGHENTRLVPLAHYSWWDMTIISGHYFY